MPEQSVFITYALNIIVNDMNALLNYYARDKRNIYTERMFVSIYSFYDNDKDTMMLEEMIDNGEILTENKCWLHETIQKIKNYYDNTNEYNKDLIKYMFEFIKLKDIINKYGKYYQYHINNLNEIREYLFKENYMPEIEEAHHHATKRQINQRVKVFEQEQLIGSFKNLQMAKNIIEQVFNIKLYDINVYMMLSKFYNKD